MAAINAACAGQDHWRAEAQGRFHDRNPDPERRARDQGQEMLNGGLLSPKATELPAGSTIFRLADGSRSTDDQFASPYWIYEKTMRAMARYAAAHGLPLRQMARDFLAVPEGWSRLDRILMAVTHAPLFAFVGRGQIVYLGDAVVQPVRTMSSSVPDVTQLFIPGLRQPGADGRPLYMTAFRGKAAHLHATTGPIVVDDLLTAPTHTFQKWPGC